MLGLLKGLNTDSKEVEGGSDGMLSFSEKERGSLEGLCGRDRE